MITTQTTAISTPRKKGFRKTLPSLEGLVHAVAERELITQNCEWKKKKKKKKKAINIADRKCLVV